MALSTHFFQKTVVWTDAVKLFQKLVFKYVNISRNFPKRKPRVFNVSSCHSDGERLYIYVNDVL